MCSVTYLTCAAIWRHRGSWAGSSCVSSHRSRIGCHQLLVHAQQRVDLLPHKRNRKLIFGPLQVFQSDCTIHSFFCLTYERCTAYSKASFPRSAIYCFLFQFPVFSLFLKVIVEYTVLLKIVCKENGVLPLSFYTQSNIYIIFLTVDWLWRQHKGRCSKRKGKAIPLQAWTGPEGSRRLRLPDFKTIGTRWW
jgi:hypothetical protein